MFHDVLPFLTVVLSQIEDPTDAHRIDTFVTNDIADFSGQIIDSMVLLLRAYVPADIVEC